MHLQIVSGRSLIPLWISVLNVVNGRKSREWTKEMMINVIAKDPQRKGYKVISKEVYVPMNTVHKIIRTFKVSGPVGYISWTRLQEQK